MEQRTGSNFFMQNHKPQMPMPLDLWMLILVIVEESMYGSKTCIHVKTMFQPVK